MLWDLEFEGGEGGQVITPSRVYIFWMLCIRYIREVNNLRGHCNVSEVSNANGTSRIQESKA